MRLAILSDIHANLPALEAVIEDVDASEAEELWCLGDVVGYGAQPDDCARIVADRCELSLVGNHDLAVLGELDVTSFSPAAAAAVEWTQESAEDATLDFLRSLKPADTEREVGLYHASPRDPVWEYVLSADQAAECLAVQAARVCMIGHSHIALFFVAADDGEEPLASDEGVEREADGSAQHDPSTLLPLAGGFEARGAQAGANTRLDLSEGRWLINPGSIGQPRDGDPRAAWLELDTNAWTATYHRIPYEIDAAAAAIAATDLPEHLARRLYVGQ